MQLSFKYTHKIADGHTPVAYHSHNNILHVFYTDDLGRLRSIQADTPLGDFSDPTFADDKLAGPENVEGLSLYYIPRINTWFVWLDDDIHRASVLHAYEAVISIGMKTIEGMAIVEDAEAVVMVTPEALGEVLEMDLFKPCIYLEPIDITKEFYGVQMESEFSVDDGIDEFEIEEDVSYFLAEEVGEN